MCIDLLGICLSMYPGLTNTHVELQKIVRSSCFTILRIHFITSWKIQETAFQGFQIQNFPGGACPRSPLDGLRLRRKIVPPPASMPWHRHWCLQAQIYKTWCIHNHARDSNVYRLFCMFLIPPTDESRPQDLQSNTDDHGELTALMEANRRLRNQVITLQTLAQEKKNKMRKMKCKSKGHVFCNSTFIMFIQCEGQNLF